MSTRPRAAGPEKRRSRPWGRWLSNGLIQIVLIGYALIVLYPLLIMIASSLKTTGEIFATPLQLIPGTFRFVNYVDAWNQANFGTYFRNSIFVGLISVVMILWFGSMAAYVLARFSFPGNRLIYLLFLAGFMIPVRLAIVPLFVMMRDLHLLDTLWSLIVVYIAGGMPFTIFLMVNFFRHVPRDLEDAAVLDGAGPFQVYYQIMLPLVRPALATVGLFHFLNVWNDFFFPLIFIRSENLRTVPLGVSTFFGEYTNDWALMFAALSISILPVIAVYLMASKQFIAGLTSGALK